MDVKILCLGALDLGDATGYEIKKMFETGIFSHFHEASFGSIYPALTRLTDDGLVTCKSQQQGGRPDKKIYSITSTGCYELEQALERPLAGDRFKSEFLFVMLFANMLSPERVTKLLEDRVEDIQSELNELQSEQDSCVNPGQEFVRGYGEAVMTASLKFIAQNRHLVEDSVRNSQVEPVR